MNAQYRFVMNPNGDYTVHFADPDMYISNLNVLISRRTDLFIHSFFQWHDILQVIIPRSSALASVTAPGELSVDVEGHTTCPICLSPPTAPRMTKCGHVSCPLVYSMTSIQSYAHRFFVFLASCTISALPITSGPGARYALIRSMRNN